MKVTIKDIAKRAQVSTATVSNVLTKKKYVSPELEQRVMEVIEATNYSPNTYARSLKINKSYEIGVHVPDITNPFFSETVKYIYKTASKKNYQIQLCISNDKVEKEKEILNNFMQKRVDGIINVAPKMKEADLIKYKDIPMVIVDRPAFKTNANMSFVYADNSIGAKSVIDYFVEKGYKKYVCFMGQVEVIPNARKRLEGFLTGMEKHGLSKENCKIYYGDFTFDSGYALMERFLQEYSVEERYGVFVSSDIMAWGALEAAKKYGVNIPSQIGVVGYDNIYFSNFINPHLTTVENPTKELGTNAIQVVLEAISSGEKMKGTSIILQPALVVRNSC